VGNSVADHSEYEALVASKKNHLQKKGKPFLSELEERTILARFADPQDLQGRMISR
jgi:hypothetical protein